MKNKRSYILIILFFLIGNISILLGIDNFIYLGGSEFSDIPITHYPNLLFIQKSLINHQQIPLWSDLIFSGYPFSSNPLSGLWYFPGWMALLFPLPLGINISLLLHLLLGMFGMFFFLKQLNISDKSAVFGAIAFAFSSKTYAHIGAGHLSLIYAISWTPWFLKYLLISFENDKKANWVIPGSFLGLMLLADLRWSIPLVFIWVTLIFYAKTLSIEKIKKSILILLSGLLLSSATWLPLLELLPHTSRSTLGANDQLIFSMNLTDFLGLLFPMQEGSAELRVYPGVIILFLAVLGISLFRGENKVKYWYMLALVSLVFSFGENIPGLNLIYNLPGFSLTRVPARFIFPFIFALIVISAIVLDKLIKHEVFTQRSKTLLGVFGVSIFIIIFSIGAMVVARNASFNFLWSIVISSLSFFWIYLLLKNSKKAYFFHFGFILIAFIDLVVINSTSLTFKKSEEVLNSNREIVELLKREGSIFRVYTPSYSISQEQGAFWEIKQVNGIDPIQLNKYINFFEDASGIPVGDYSVTLPPFKTGNPTGDNAEYCPDLTLLNELNTRYIISSFPLVGCINTVPSIISTSYVYDISHSENYMKFLDCDNGELLYSINKYSPNKIEFQVNSCGGYLQISEINYPGWKIFIDGQRAPLEPESFFRTFFIPEGEHSLSMVYQPLISIGSAILQFSLWILNLVTIVYLYRKDHEKKLV